jgi:hypothetical protein
MKINGVKICGANIEYVVIPRYNGDIVFKCEAVLNYKEFDALYPEPKIKLVMIPGGKMIPDMDDTNFKIQKADYNSKRYAWTVITSLKNSPGLEWETIDFSKTETWENYEQELRDSDFTTNEINMVLMGVLRANSLDEVKLIEARDSFLASLVVQAKLSSQTAELKDTQSGQLAKD